MYIQIIQYYILLCHYIHQFLLSDLLFAASLSLYLSIYLSISLSLYIYLSIYPPPSLSIWVQRFYLLQVLK